MKYQPEKKAKESTLKFQYMIFLFGPQCIYLKGANQLTQTPCVLSFD